MAIKSPCDEPVQRATREIADILERAQFRPVKQVPEQAGGMPTRKPEPLALKIGQERPYVANASRRNDTPRRRG
jgi:hypothetical protein